MTLLTLDQVIEVRTLEGQSGAKLGSGMRQIRLTQVLDQLIGDDPVDFGRRVIEVRTLEGEPAFVSSSGIRRAPVRITEPGRLSCGVLRGF
jgi:hypothetical protein